MIRETSLAIIYIFGFIVITHACVHSMFAAVILTFTVILPIILYLVRYISIKDKI